MIKVSPVYREHYIHFQGENGSLSGFFPRKLNVVVGPSGNGKTLLSSYIDKEEQDHRILLQSSLSVRYVDTKRQLEDACSGSPRIILADDLLTASEAEIRELLQTDNIFVFFRRTSFNSIPVAQGSMFEAQLRGTRMVLAPYYVNDISPLQDVRRVLVEDSKSGLEFFSNVFPGISVESYYGRKNIKKVLEDPSLDSRTLVLYDKSGIGKGLQTIREYKERGGSVKFKGIESFEYLLLTSELLASKVSVEHLAELRRTRLNTEAAYTEYLVELTCSPYKYSKKKEELPACFIKDCCHFEYPSPCDLKQFIGKDKVALILDRPEYRDLYQLHCKLTHK